MNPELESLITAYFEAFNRHDLEAQLATLHPEVRHDLNEGGTEIGIEKFRAFKTHMDACYREQIEELVVMSCEDRGAAEFIVSGVYLANDGDLAEARGQSYRIPAAAFFELRNGKLGRVTSYYNLKGWLEAVR